MATKNQTKRKTASREGSKSTGIRKTVKRSIQGEDVVLRTTDYKQQKREQQDVFAPALQKAHTMVREVMAELGTEDRPRAYTALRAVLQTLRDRLPMEECAQLGAQLPMIIRGMYFEGWEPSSAPLKYSKEEFMECVRGHFRNLSGVNILEVIQGVFRVLDMHVSEGEMNHIRAALPEQFVEFWSEEAALSR